jgi:hypothetical protein
MKLDVKRACTDYGVILKPVYFEKFVLFAYIK